MKSPKISIIIPTYNRGTFIKNTIKCVINQTFTDWELLVVDDGSTDNTAKIVKELCLKDSRIKYLYQENSGCPSSPRNLGIKNATGEFVAFLDSDDEWYREKLERQIKLFENSQDPHLGIVTCFACIKEYKTGKMIAKRNNFYRGNILKELAHDNFIFTSSCVMTKLSILKGAGLFDTRFKISEDWDMWIRISKLGYTADFVPEYLMNYVAHDKNIYYRNKSFDNKKKFLVLIAFINKHKDLYIKLKSPMIGFYYLYLRRYKLSRKYLIKNIFDKRTNMREKIRTLIYIFISYFPNSRHFFNKILH